MRFLLARLALGAAAASGLAMAPARAAGGHFDVDDAVMLAPGHCQVETWAARPADGSAATLHIGPACRAGPVELGLNADHTPAANDRAEQIGPQIKWVVDPVAARLSTGLVWGFEVDAQHGGRPVQLAYAVATWWPAESLQIHVNAGADWGGGQARTQRFGLSGEWAASDRFSLLAERLAARSSRVLRLGTGINLSDAVSLDLSASQAGRAGVHGFAIGLNREFTR